MLTVPFATPVRTPVVESIVALPVPFETDQFTLLLW